MAAKTLTELLREEHRRRRKIKRNAIHDNVFFIYSYTIFIYELCNIYKGKLITENVM